MGNLTAMKLRHLKDPGRYSDGGGLILVVKQSGKASWIVRVQAQGKRQDIGIGGYPDVSLIEAREQAMTIRRQTKAGVDVLAERRKEQDKIPTFREAATRVHEEHKKGWKNGKHQAQWLTTLERYAFPHFGNVLVSEVQVSHIRDALIEIWLDKPETARRVRQRIGAVLDWSFVKGYRSTEAPMRSISRGLPRQPKKTGHFSAMPFSELPNFMRKLRSRASVGSVALELLILNASRSGEVRHARWNEFDFTRKLWTIPGARMKMGRDHIVPLSAQAIDVLERAKSFRIDSSDLAFPGQKRRRPLSDMTLLKILRDAGTSYTVHGFRSSFRDWVAEKTSYPGEVAEAALAHAIPNKVEAAYRRTDYLDKRRKLMKDWSAFCCGDGRKPK